MNKYFPDNMEPTPEDLQSIEGKYDFIPDRYANTAFLFINEVTEYPLLTEEETIELAKSKDAGDKEARTKLIESNMRLVFSVAKTFAPMNSQIYPELVQEGSIGLTVAVDKYDFKKGCQFSTYAFWWIRQAITRWFANESRTIRLPVHAHDTLCKLKKISNIFFSEHGYFPSNKELADISGISEKEIDFLLVSQTSLSLNAFITNECDSDTELGDFIADENFLIDEISERDFLKENLSKFIKTYFHNQPRVSSILIQRYGLDGNEEKTLEELAAEYNLTRERIRQIEARALKKLLTNSTFRKTFSSFSK